MNRNSDPGVDIRRMDGSISEFEVKFKRLIDNNRRIIDLLGSLGAMGLLMFFVWFLSDGNRFPLKLTSIPDLDTGRPALAAIEGDDSNPFTDDEVKLVQQWFEDNYSCKKGPDIILVAHSNIFLRSLLLKYLNYGYGGFREVEAIKNDTLFMKSSELALVNPIGARPVDLNFINSNYDLWNSIATLLHEWFHSCDNGDDMFNSELKANGLSLAVNMINSNPNVSYQTYKEVTEQTTLAETKDNIYYEDYGEVALNTPLGPVTPKIFGTLKALLKKLDYEVGLEP